MNQMTVGVKAAFMAQFSTALQHFNKSGATSACQLPQAALGDIPPITSL